METKLEKLKGLWAAGDFRAALKLASSWPRLGAHKEAIQRGWAATTNGAIYRQMGQDPEHLYRVALAALAVQYELPPPRKPNAKG